MFNKTNAPTVTLQQRNTIEPPMTYQRVGGRPRVTYHMQLPPIPTTNKHHTMLEALLLLCQCVSLSLSRSLVLSRSPSRCIYQSLGTPTSPQSALSSRPILYNCRDTNYHTYTTDYIDCRAPKMCHPNRCHSRNSCSKSHGCPSCCPCSAPTPHLQRWRSLARRCVPHYVCQICPMPVL